LESERLGAPDRIQYQAGGFRSRTQSLNQFNGVQRFKKAANEALAEIMITKAA
jgi:hypothetical protein